MGCGPSAAEKQYRVEREQVITAHRDVMRGLRLSQGDMEALYEIHLHLCELDKAGTAAGELDVSGLLVGCGIEGDATFLRRMFKIFDTDGSGELGYREFVLGVWSLLSLDKGDLPGFTFWLYDHDYNGHLEISELMNILNDVHGRGTANPNGFSSKTPHYERALQHFEKFSKKKHSSVRRGNGEEPFVTNGEFIEFSKNTPSLLWPAFRIQTELAKKIGGEKFWKAVTARRQQARLSTMAWMKRLKELGSRKHAEDGNEGAKPRIVVTDKRFKQAPRKVIPQ